MFGIEIKEVAVKELTQISDEVLNQKRSLHTRGLLRKKLRRKNRKDWTE